MRCVISILTVLIFCNHAFCKEKITVSYFNVSPHVIYNFGTEKIEGGAVYDFLENHIAPEMDIDLVWDSTPTSIPRQIKFLENREKDCAALLIFTASRAQDLLFTAKPYAYSYSAIAVPASDPIEHINTVEDILSHRIGYGQNAFLCSFMKDERLKLDLIASSNYNEQNFRKLLAGRINAVYTPDIPSLMMVIKKMNIEDKVKIIKLPGIPARLYVVFSKKRQDLKKKYDKAFDKIGGRNVYTRILNSYIQP